MSHPDSHPAQAHQAQAHQAQAHQAQQCQAQPCQAQACRYPPPSQGFFKEIGALNYLFFGLAVLTGAIGFFMQRVAFPEAGSAYEPVQASVYVQNLPAHVTMSADFSPGAPKNLTITVTVSGPNQKVDPALVVVQCAASPQRSHPGSVQLYSESTAPRQFSGNLLAFTDDSPGTWQRSLSCYTGLTSDGQKAATVIKDQDINLTMPVLQANPDPQSALPFAPLYAESRDPGHTTVAALVEVLNPRRSCAGPAGYPPPSTANGGRPLSSAATGSAGSGSGSPAAPLSPPASPSPAAGTCFTSTMPGAAVTTYKFPSSVATTETLQNVNLADDRIDSIYPSGLVGDNTIAWQGADGLAPSVSATNLASANRQNKDAFWAGLLYGLGAAVAVPFIQGVAAAWKARRPG